MPPKRLPVKTAKQTEEQLTAAKDAANAKDAPKGVVWLTWDQSRVWIVHPRHGARMLTKLVKADAVATPEEIKEALADVQQVNIIPGLHSYPVKQWNAIKEHQDVIQALSDGRLSIYSNADLGLSGDPTKPAQTLPDSLDNISTGNARALADNCQDLPTLKRWLEAETKGKARGTITQLLEAQIETIEENEKRFKAANGES